MFPDADSPPDKKHAFYSALYEQSGQWLKERPNCPLFWGYRWDAIENLDDIPATQVEADVDQALQTFVRDGGPKGVSPGGYSRAAEILSKKQLEPQRVVDLAQQGLVQWESESKRPFSDLFTKEEQETRATNRAENRLRLLGYEIDGYLQLKQADKAQVQLEQMDRWLQEFKSLGGKENAVRTDASLYVVYWELRAHVAELQGRRQDAMAFYENALLARFTALEKPETGRRDQLATSAHQLWTGLGGTEEGWQLWYGRPANELANRATLTWQEVHEPLPAFELADLHDKTWNLAALKGKTVFLNFWATW
jgi:tetratricopeptide (TPR) repeat protein